jgi:DNA polymerase-3 subunit alpha
MKIAQVLAGYSLGEADLLRRAMGKKKPAEMEKQKETFLAGTDKNKIARRKAEEIFNLMANFAGYGFNKSHSVAYAVIAYQTACLKAHHPVEFMAALLTCEMDNSDKVIRHIGECRDRGIEVLPPDVNESFRDFTVTDNKIRFGLAAVKNVGTAAIESIITAREEGGPFANIYDFCERIDLRKANKKVLESLIKCGAFDATHAHRSQLFTVCETAVERGQEKQREKNDRQKSIFELISNDESSGITEPEYPSMPEWPEKELLANEKETLGFFISSHPLSSYEKELKCFFCVDSAEIQSRRDGEEVHIGGVPVSVNEIVTRRGDRMAFVTLEDLKGSLEVIVFANLYKDAAPLLKSEQPLLLKGKVDLDERSQKVKVRAEEINLLSEATTILTKTIHFNLDITQMTKPHFKKLRNILRSHPGSCAAYLHLHIPKKSETIIPLPDEFHLEPSEGLLKEVEYLFGSKVVSLR